MKDKTRCDGTMTEAQYWGMIRSALRDGSLRWLPLQKILNDNRRPYRGPDRRQRWEYLCSMCNKWYPRKHIERDHAQGCGVLNEETAGLFITRMYCDTKYLRLLCKGCHGVVTYAEARKISLEESSIRKRVINLLKDKNNCVNILSSFGYTKPEMSNEEKRKDLLYQLIKDGRL